MRKVLYALSVLLLTIMMFAGCSTGPSTGNPSQIVKEISASEAYTLVQANVGRADFIILDVRTPSEFSSGHLEGAILIDVNAGNFREKVNKLDKNKNYLVYCRTSNRSGQAVAIMKDLGFKEVYDMDGGIVAWQVAGYPTIK